MCLPNRNTILQLPTTKPTLSSDSQPQFGNFTYLFISRFLAHMTILSMLLGVVVGTLKNIVIEVKTIGLVNIY